MPRIVGIAIIGTVALILWGGIIVCSNQLARYVIERPALYMDSSTR